jgi:hypothetical protein
MQTGTALPRGSILLIPIVLLVTLQFITLDLYHLFNEDIRLLVVCQTNNDRLVDIFYDVIKF